MYGSISCSVSVVSVFFLVSCLLFPCFLICKPPEMKMLMSECGVRFHVIAPLAQKG